MIHLAVSMWGRFRDLKVTSFLKRNHIPSLYTLIDTALYEIIYETAEIYSSTHAGSGDVGDFDFREEETKQRERCSCIYILR